MTGRTRSNLLMPAASRALRVSVCGWVICAAALFLPCGAARADTGSPHDAKIEDLEKRITALESELDQLTNEGGSETGLAELRRRIDLLAAEVAKLRIGEAAAEVPLRSEHGMGPAASRVYDAPRGVSIGGYGEMLYQNFDARDESGDPSGETDRLDFLRGVLYFGYKFKDRIVLNSEIEFEHATTEQQGSVSVEFAYLDFLLSPHANVRAGLVLVPAGFINELHEPPIFLGARRPEVELRIIPTTWSDNGVGVVGEAGPFSYRAYVLAGLNSAGFSAGEALAEGRQAGSESAAQDLALAARADYTGTPGLLAGGFFYRGDSAQGHRAPAGFSFDPNGRALSPATRPFDGAVTLYDFHAQYKARGLELRALYAAGSIGNAKQINDAEGLSGAQSVGSRFYGWYAQAGYDVFARHAGEAEPSLIPYVRYERFNTQSSVPGQAPQPLSSTMPALPFRADPANDVSILTVGAAYKPIFNVSVKADYARVSNEAGTGVSVASVSLGYLF